MGDATIFLAFGYAGALLNTLGAVPTIEKALRTNSVEDFSALYLAVYLPGNFVAGLYGVYFELVPVVIPSAFWVVALIVVIWLKRRRRVAGVACGRQRQRVQKRYT